jgi:hypothetical protein
MDPSQTGSAMERLLGLLFRITALPNELYADGNVGGAIGMFLFIWGIVPVLILLGFLAGARWKSRSIHRKLLDGSYGAPRQPAADQREPEVRESRREQRAREREEARLSREASDRQRLAEEEAAAAARSSGPRTSGATAAGSGQDRTEAGRT